MTHKYYLPKQNENARWVNDEQHETSSNAVIIIGSNGSGKSPEFDTCIARKPVK